MTISRTPRRWAALSALTLAAGLSVAGCAEAPLTVVAGTGTAPGGATTVPGAPIVIEAPGQPLVAADLPEWGEAALPEWANASLVQPCGEPTGLREQQSAVRAAALTTPTGITVLNQVGDYAGTDPVAAINDTLTRALLACPAYVADGQDVSVRALAGAEGATSVGAEVTRTDQATGLREVTIYWAALTGTSTVEVSVMATLGSVGDPPLEEFALNVLAAAQAKALGQPLPAVAAPALPAPMTYEEEAAARSELEAERAQTGELGLDAEENGLLTQEEADRAAAEQSALQVPIAPEPEYVDHGIDGEAGPGVITGER